MTMQWSSGMFKPLALLLCMLAACTGAWSQDTGFRGELGLMGVRSSALVTGSQAQSSVLPYVYGDWGRAYGRIDTFGVRTLPLGHGHLELALTCTLK